MIISFKSTVLKVATQIFHFIINHWILWSLFLLLILIIVFEEIRGRVQGIPRVGPSDLTRMINREEAIIIDLRDPASFSKGHIIGSLNIPHLKLDVNIDRLKKLHPKSIVLVCGNGQTAPQEGVKLKEKGVENISFLSGGIASWREANLPLAKGD